MGEGEDHFMVMSWVRCTDNGTLHGKFRLRLGVLQYGTLHGEFMADVPSRMEYFMVRSWVRIRCTPEWNTSWYVQGENGCSPGWNTS